jgi:hypothetical protein
MSDIDQEIERLKNKIDKESNYLSKDDQFYFLLNLNEKLLELIDDLNIEIQILKK